MSPMKILLVDDSKSARYALRLQLQRFGIAVEALESAEAALERIREAPPDAVFMDHTMPGMNGFEALEILKTSAATAHIPVVMCTSNEDPDFIAQAQRKGAFSILSKSTAADKLPDLIDRLQRNAAGTAVAAAPPAAAARPAGDAGAALRGEVERLIDERLEGRMRALLEPRLTELRAVIAAEAAAGLASRVETLARELAAEAAAGGGPGLDARLDAHAERVGTEAARRTEETLTARLSAETERLHGHFAQIQNEQSQRTAQRLASELIPQMVRKELTAQRQEIAHLVQELLDSAMDALVHDPGFLRKVADAMEESAVARAENAARLEVERLSETVAIQRAAEVAEGMVQAARGAGRRMVLLATLAALAGVASSVVVYLLVA